YPVRPKPRELAWLDAMPRPARRVPQGRPGTPRRARGGKAVGARRRSPGASARAREARGPAATQPRRVAPAAGAELPWGRELVPAAVQEPGRQAAAVRRRARRARRERRRTGPCSEGGRLEAAQPAEARAWLPAPGPPASA